MRDQAIQDRAEVAHQADPYPRYLIEALEYYVSLGHYTAETIIAWFRN